MQYMAVNHILRFIAATCMQAWRMRFSNFLRWMAQLLGHLLASPLTLETLAKTGAQVPLFPCWLLSMAPPSMATKRCVPLQSESSPKHVQQSHETRYQDPVKYVLTLYSMNRFGSSSTLHMHDSTGRGLLYCVRCYMWWLPAWVMFKMPLPRKHHMHALHMHKLRHIFLL